MRNIIWDFDGTLFDTDSAIIASFLLVLENGYGIKEDETKIRTLIKIDTKACAKILSADYGLNEKLLISQAREVYDRFGVDFQKPIDGTHSACEKVLELGGFNALVTHRDKASTEALLKYYDFYKYFACIITRDDNFELKPSPESFLHVIDLLSLDKAVTCGVGDRVLDVGAANSANISSYFFCSLGTKCSTATFNIRAIDELVSTLS